MIGGPTEYDATDAALSAIMTEWTGRKSLATRIDNLTNGFGPALQYKLTRVETVVNDLLADTLFGGNGSDWFLGLENDLIVDRGAKDR